MMMSSTTSLARSWLSAFNIFLGIRESRKKRRGKELVFRRKREARMKMYGFFYGEGRYLNHEDGRTCTLRNHFFGFIEDI